MTLVKERSGAQLLLPRSSRSTAKRAPRGPPPIEPRSGRKQNRWPSWMVGFALTVVFVAFAAIPPPDRGGHDAEQNPVSVTEPTASVPLTEPSPTIPSGFDSEINAEPVAPATAEQSLMISEALTQFDNAGLELPEVQIEFHDGYDGCRGHAGLFVAASGNPEVFVDRVTICHHHKLILLHELAHVWIHHNADEDTKAAFVEQWGLSSWSNSSEPYVDLGIERAAQTIAFTLNQTELTESQAVLRYICSYELLTGTTTDIHSKVDCQAPEITA